LAVDTLKCADIVIFLTQDSILADSYAIEKMVKEFNADSVGVVCGRQLPHKEAGLFAAHARYYNYPAKSRTITKDDIPELGIKAAFVSNSFAAYRKSALQQVGGFPDNVILGEDMAVAAKMVLADWSVRYSAEARSYHSHDYSIIQEFKRYFDTGVFHRVESWLLEDFGVPESEGFKFLKSEVYRL
jgi:rhamnosyltransferase